MKKAGIFSLFIIISLCLFLGCTDEGEEELGSVVGVWEYTIPTIPTITSDTLLITIDIEDVDSTFYLEIREIHDDTLYWQSGTWDIHHTGGARDSVFLYGQIGEVIDTTADPDTLKVLEDSLAQKTLAIDTAASTGDLWVIKIKNLEDILVNFISQQTINMFANTFDLRFTRKE